MKLRNNGPMVIRVFFLLIDIFLKQNHFDSGGGGGGREGSDLEPVLDSY